MSKYRYHHEVMYLINNKVYILDVNIR